ncbi:hypothetical protein DSO57_1017249 [Entomophthora muscae]|uniref:Uncharacterized protein n=1 Tax=Entomophthora muscae TaxID=34485 RepID=A0ACC2TFD4_9FUNG|nr:hypothetical protein DSO57_1017249 [Entomophthora muscae]
MSRKPLAPDGGEPHKEDTPKPALEYTLDIESEDEPPNSWLKDFILSSQLQRILIGFVFVYITIALFDMTLTLTIGKKKLHRLYNKWIKDIKFSEIFIMSLFPVELLLRAYYSKEGFLGYFKKPWNVVDFLLVLTCASFDIAEYFVEDLFLEITLVLIGFRLFRALRTLFFYSRAQLRLESVLTSDIHEVVTTLSEQLDALLKENEGLQKTLDESNSKVKNNLASMDKIAQTVLQEQNSVWTSQVPISGLLFLKPQTSDVNLKRQIKRSDTIG